jgi:hypothetical protein
MFADTRQNPESAFLVQTPLFTIIIAVSVFFLAAWELMVLNDRLNISPPGLTLRGWLMLIYAFHISCIAISAVCLGLRLKLSDSTANVFEKLERKKVLLSRATNLAVIAFATSILLSGLLIIGLAELSPSSTHEEMLEESLEAAPTQTAFSG